jgi:autotransporter translocation and assembly factor TamB
MATEKKRSLPRKLGRWLVRGFGFLIAGLIALVLLVIASINLPPGREFIRTHVNDALADTFTGKLMLDRIGYVGFDRVGNVRVSVFDARGRKVLALSGVSLRAAWPGVVLDAIRKRPLSIEITPVRCEHIEVTLIDDGTGSPTLASAFSPRHPTPSDPNAAPVSIHVPDLAVRHVWAHGGLQAVPVIDAEVADLVVAFASVPDALTIELKRARLVTRALPSALNPRGKLSAKVVLPSAPKSKPSGFANFDGSVAGGPTTLHAELTRDQVKAKLEAKAIPAQLLRDQAPSVTLSGPTSVELTADGTLPALAFRGRVANEALNVGLRGTAELGDATRASLELEAREVDLHRLMATLPESALALDAAASVVSSKEGALSGEYSVSVPQGRVQKLVTPATTTSGTLSRGQDQRLRVDGKLLVDERGAAVNAQYEFTMTKQGEQRARAQLSVDLADPPRVKALFGASARGKLKAVADVDLTQQQLSATLNADLAPVALPPERVARVVLEATATGPLADPAVKLTLEAKDAVLASQKFRHLRVDATGRARRVAVHAAIERAAGERGVIDTVISNTQKLELLETKLALAARETELKARIARASFGGGQVRVTGLELEGAGSLSASGSWQNGKVTSEFSMHDLDAPRLARLANVEIPLKRGLVSGGGVVSGPVQRLRGMLQVDARDLDFKETRNGRLKLDLMLDEKTVNGKLKVQFGLSNLEAELDHVDLPGSSPNRSELVELRGAITAKGEFDLGYLAPTLRAFDVPIERAQGQVTLDLRAENPRNAESKPTLDLKVTTHRLKLVEQRTKPPNIETQPTARAAEPRSIEDVDVRLALLIDASTRDGRVDLEFFDKRGTIATVNAETKLPNFGGGNLAVSLQQQPMKVALSVPSRALEQLPASIRPKSIRGLVQLDASADGTVLAPKLDVAVALRHLKAFEEQRGVDCDAKLKFDREGGEVTATANSFRGRAADLTTKWRGDLLKALSTPEATANTGFLMDADLKLEAFPLGIVPQLSDRQIRGPLSGNVELRGLGRDAQLKAKLDGARLRIGHLRVPGLSASATTEGGALAASVVVVQPDGGLQAKVTTPMQWGARIIPVVDLRAKAELHAQQFQLETLSPLLLSYVSAIEGRLDANFRAELGDGAPKLEGQAELKQGVLQLPQIGQRLSDMSGKVSIKEGEIRLDSLEAHGTNGKLTANARARIQGTTLESVKARVDIKKNEKFPITFEGVSMGDAWGHAELAYTSADRKSDIRVDVPDFHLQMPDQSPGSVQDLAPDEHVRIGFRRQDGKFVAVPVQPLEPSKTDANEAPAQTTVKVHLGDSVWVERGQQATVQLSGDLTIISGVESKMEGHIELRGGKLDVNGKTFDIESGVVTFEGSDSSNPTIIATARWDAPGYTVYADYAGTVKAGKLTLRAEPPLTQSEIISLLLFGSPEGSLGADSGGGGGSAATALGVAGDTAVKGFNRVMSDFTHLDVSARIDTSTGSARPELVVQVTPRLTTRVTRAIGEPPPGQSPDRTFLTLELRLLRSWALSGVVGDRGSSSLDLIWRHRY